MIQMQVNQELTIQKIKELFNTLPFDVKKRTLTELNRTTVRNLTYYITIDDVTYKCKSIINVAKTLVVKGGISSPDRSNIYKVVRKGGGKIYGYQLYVE